MEPEAWFFAAINLHVPYLLAVSEDYERGNLSI
jgi:hypothetical protein